MGKPWADHERKVARSFGTKRLLQGGRSVPDFATDRIVGECKYREKYSVISLYLATKEKYKDYIGDRKFILVLKEKGRHGEMVCLPLEDFLELTGLGVKDGFRV